MSTSSRLLSLLALLCLVAQPAAAQYPTLSRGFQSDRAYQFNDIDSVNLFNGNLVVSIPIGQEYGSNGNLNYQMRLVYNSKNWDFEQHHFSPPQGSQYPEGYYNKAVPTRLSNAGMGWILTLGRLVAPEDPANQYPVDGSLVWTYVAPDGSSHPFRSTIHSGQQSTTGYQYTNDGSFLRMKEVSSTIREIHTSDGSIKTFAKGGNRYFLTEIRDVFGNYVTISYRNSLDQVLSPSQYEVADVWKLLEYDQSNTLIRTQIVRFATRSPLNAPSNYNRQVSEIELSAFGTTTAKYVFNYVDTMVPYDTSGGDYRGSEETPDPKVPLLTSVTIPDGPSGSAGSAWSWTYSSSDLSSITLPTLGKIEYTYQAYLLPTNSCAEIDYPDYYNEHRPFSVSRGVQTRRFRDASGTEKGLWKYTPVHMPSGYTSDLCPGGIPETIYGESTTTVQEPSGHKSVHYFAIWPENVIEQGPYRARDFGLPYSRTKSVASPTTCDPTVGSSLCRSVEWLECDSNGANCSTPKRTSYLRYEGDQEASATSGYRRLAESRIVESDGSWVNSKHTDYDGLGHYRQTFVTSGGFLQSTSQTSYTRHLISNASTTTYPSYEVDPVTWNQTTTFNGPATTDPWILSKWDESWKSDGTKAEKTEACFEPLTGFLTRTRVLQNTAATPGAIQRHGSDLLTVRTRDAKGNMIREEHLGGDSANVSTLAGLCSITLPAHNSSTFRIDHSYSSGALATSAYVNVPGTSLMSFYSTFLEIDANTGLPKKEWVGRSTAQGATDGVPTAISYDRLGRLEWLKPGSGDGPWRQLVYTRATSASSLAKVTVFDYANGTTSGALAQDEYWYDSFGRLWKERRLMDGGSMATRETLYDSSGRPEYVSEWDVSLSPASKTEYDYDWAGRVNVIHPPDHNSPTAHKHDVTFTYSGNRQRIRTVSIGTTEGGESNVTTTEDYDAHGRLHKVTEGGIPTTYKYDASDRLTEVSMVSGTTQTRTFQYDGRGLLWKETHPENGPTEYKDFDARGHATRVENDPVSSHLDSWTKLDRAERVVEVRQGSASGALLKEFSFQTDGRLQQATRHHSGSAAGWKVVENFSYNAAGRPISKTTKVYEPNGVNPAKTWTSPLTWDSEGLRDNLEYPHLGTVRRTLDLNYAKGRLASIASITSANASYSPGGLPSLIPHMNGFTDELIIDSGTRMSRPAEIRFLSASSARDAIVWRHAGTGANAVWLLNGLSLHLGTTLPTVSLAFEIRGFEDLDGDGVRDVFWRNKSTGENTAWVLDNGVIETGLYLPSVAGTNFTIAAVGDLSGDGRADLVWRNETNGDVPVWIMNNDVISSSAVVATVSDLNMKIRGVGDINGDGRADILWRNQATGDNAVWLMNGTTLVQDSHSRS